MMSRMEVKEIAENYDYFMMSTDSEYREYEGTMPETERLKAIMASFENKDLIIQDIEYIEQGLYMDIYNGSAYDYAVDLLADMKDVYEFYSSGRR